jgi:hypothetical protein
MSGGYGDLEGSDQREHRIVSIYDNVSESQSQVDGAVGEPAIFRASIQWGLPGQRADRAACSSAGHGQASEIIQAFSLVGLYRAWHLLHPSA